MKKHCGKKNGDKSCQSNQKWQKMTFLICRIMKSPSVGVSIEIAKLVLYLKNYSFRINGEFETPNRK